MDKELKNVQAVCFEILDEMGICGDGLSELWLGDELLEGEESGNQDVLPEQGHELGIPIAVQGSAGGIFAFVAVSSVNNLFVNLRKMMSWSSCGRDKSGCFLGMLLIVVSIMVS